MAKLIGLVVKNSPEVMQQADELEQWLKSRGCGVVRAAPSGSPVQIMPHRASDGMYCVVVLGGDGTFLSAVRWLSNQQVPILGVKFGQIGFLAETEVERLFDTIQEILDGRFATRPRMRIQTEVWRLNEKVMVETVLNDVVINKGALARLALIKTHINDCFLTDYRADGLIVATPTGSTAYSLAAGGPIIHPAVPAILITPICPFTLTNRPLIVPDNAVVGIQLAEKSKDIMLTFDGQVGLPIDEKYTLKLRKAEHPVQLIKLPEREFYDVLKTKLRWGGSPGVVGI